MKVKLKGTQPGNRTIIYIGGHGLKMNKSWREVTPSEFEELYKNHSNVLDFFTPELNAIKNVLKAEEIKKVEEPKHEEKKDTNVLNISKLKSMSKDDLEKFARVNYGVELDKRRSTTDMIKTLISATKK